tara:strand:- start:1141 stop:1632 length:492 start_codon:yes stop_codon:yes gene_type:complete
MSFFYSFPSELVRFTLQDNSICLEYPRDRLYSTVLIFYFASTCLFLLASLAFRSYGLQLFVIHADLLVFVVLQMLLIQKGMQWAQCFLAMAESTFAMTDTIRRDSIRRRSQTQAQARPPRRTNYENSALRRESAPDAAGEEPHSIDIDMSKLNSALKNGSLFG